MRLIAAKSCSMGFKSGEYGSKNKSVAVLLSISSWVLETFVEGGVIPDHHMRVVQQGTELGFQRPIEDGRVA